MDGWYRSPLRRQSISQWYTMWLNNKMCAEICPYPLYKPSPHSKVHGANIWSIWGRQDPGGPQVGPWILLSGSIMWSFWDPSFILLYVWIKMIDDIERFFTILIFNWYSLPYGHSSCMPMDKHKIFVTPVRKLLFWLRCSSNCTLDKETHLFVTWDANTYMCESLENINHSFKNNCRYIY